MERSGKQTIARSFCFLWRKRHRGCLEKKACVTQQQEALKQRTGIPTPNIFLGSAWVCPAHLHESHWRVCPPEAQPPIPQSHGTHQRRAVTATSQAAQRTCASCGGHQGFNFRIRRLDFVNKEGSRRRETVRGRACHPCAGLTIYYENPPSVGKWVKWLFSLPFLPV